MLAPLLLALALAQSGAESADKLIVVRAASGAVSGTLERFERDGETWKSLGPATRVVVGKNGVVTAADKVEGDLSTPAGQYRLVGATGYERNVPRGTKLPYVQASATLKCVDDPRSKYYNRVLDERTVEKDWSRAEEMRLPDDRYRRVLILDYNASPTIPGKGSCIFFHVWRTSESPTAGCIAMPLRELDKLLGWADENTRVEIRLDP